ncbi:class I SAM-dependent methyltransferase [Sporolactobacillus spathodeae]|uniref:Site-specific DNA-methyltransferase (Adenine-specific) n=1 Tax=Sporolactobacillus spathodeae TaxID=1465502 RepID=A0ABS2QB43_9BACL|nr:class I SAM-dependent methyltransferase [Sporolactobacillus spathodeae]MBM7659018.1 site-specific DNA-methyltransferase (adenine-specific) [Sporolactobacillus spathodeae]
MQTSRVSELFSILDNAALILRKVRKTSYLEALCAAGEQITNGQIDDASVKSRLQPLYDNFFQEGMTAEDVRRAFQLAVLKGTKQPGETFYDMTPDALVLFIGHMARLLVSDKQAIILDPAVGSANLLTGVLNQLDNESVTACGVEINDLLIRLAYTNANLQQQAIHLLHQDGLKKILQEPADLVVSDPPVGIYPDAESAKSYQLTRMDGKAYTHFLFIEQGLNALKEAGYLLYLIPNRLFSDDKEKTFYRYLAKNAVVLALLQLPLSLFQTPEAAKSILLLQKKGTDVRLPKQTLLAELPDFSDEAAMRAFMKHMDSWFAEHRKDASCGG